MRVLIVKTSSLGDIVHTLPAVTDAARAARGVRFDWVAEESYAAIPSLHPAVGRVIPCATRRWRRSWFRAWARGEWRRFVAELRQYRYDAVIDAQGLVKSALIVRKAVGVKHGFDRTSAREPFAALFYELRHHIARDRHAIARTRELFARALRYDYAALPLDYGLTAPAGPATDAAADNIMFLHGASWESKRWPLSFWRELADRLTALGKRILIPAADPAERRFARDIACGDNNIRVLPPMPLADLIPVLAACRAVVAVDTGPAHLAAAYRLPAVVLYGATSARRTGALSGHVDGHAGGNRGSQAAANTARALQADYPCSPCFARRCDKMAADGVAPCTNTLSAATVADELIKQIGAK